MQAHISNRNVEQLEFSLYPIVLAEQMAMSPLAVLEVKSSTHVPRGVARTSLHVPRWRASRIALHAPAKASILAEFSTMEPTQGLEQSLLLLAPAPGTIREGARRATARNCCCHTTAHAKTKRAPRTEEGYRPGAGVVWSLFLQYTKWTWRVQSG